jgi:ankyrin repeat protein
MLATKNGHTDIVQSLLNNGANVNAIDNKGRTALILASENGAAGIVQILLEKGADINAQNFYGETALTYAQGKLDNKVAKLLKPVGAKR